MGNLLREVDLNVEEGGDYKYTFVNEKDNKTFEITGQYSQVEEEKKLVYSWNWKADDIAVENNNYTLTIVFAAEGEGSKIEIAQSPLHNEEALQQHKQGWDKALADLDTYLGRDKDN